MPHTKEIRTARATALATAVATGLGMLLASGSARAEREHLVREGQTLSRIAQRYEIPVGALATANRMTATSPLHPGQTLRVPDRDVRYVGAGQTLASIAQHAGVSIAELAATNHIKEDANLQIGQRIVLPGHRDVPTRPLERVGGSRRGPQGAARIPTTFYRSATKQHAKVRLLTRSGKPSPAARQKLALLMKPRNGKRTMLPHPRLLVLLSRISARFEGKPIHIISGYRKTGGNTHRTSRHTMARAIDLRIPGVSNTALRDFCRKFDSVGVGYYPRSVFVHLDVRDRNAFWVDLSGPGEAPRYRRYKPWVEEQQNELAEDDSADSIDEEDAAAVDNEQEHTTESGPADLANVAPKATPSVESATPGSSPRTTVQRKLPIR